MSRIRFLPHLKYKLVEIERWLEKKAEEGWRLKQLHGIIAVFRRMKEGERVCYRVKYVPSNREINGALFSGNLYVYQADTPEKLPERSTQDFVDAKRVTARWNIYILVLLDFTYIRILYEYFVEGHIAVFVITILFIVALHLFVGSLLAILRTGENEPSEKLVKFNTMTRYIFIAALILLFAGRQWLVIQEIRQLLG